MKRLSIVVILFGTLIAAGGCGQRGALVLPKTPEPVAKPEARKLPSNPDTPVAPKSD